MTDNYFSTTTNFHLGTAETTSLRVVHYPAGSVSEITDEYWAVKFQAGQGEVTIFCKTMDQVLNLTTVRVPVA